MCQKGSEMKKLLKSKLCYVLTEIHSPNFLTGPLALQLTLVENRREIFSVGRDCYKST